MLQAISWVLFVAWRVNTRNLAIGFDTLYIFHLVNREWFVFTLMSINDSAQHPADCKY